MAADEHLRRSFDALATRLRDDISRQLDAISGELKTSLGIEQERAAAAAEEARVRALASAAEAHEEALERARREARAEAAREAEERDNGRLEALELARAEREASDIAASLRLLEGIRALDRARSLSDVLDTLATGAAGEVARVAVFLVRGHHLRAWRLTGFGAELGERADFELPIAGAGVVNDAIRTGAAASGNGAADASAPPFASLPPGREMLALPVPMSGQIVAVLYADQGEREPERRTAWPATLEVMTRHAARSLEAITALRAAQAFSEPQGGPAPVAPRAPAPATRAAAAVDPAEEEQSARRYARLLISEIKLYHEADVAAGRRERNLADRLGGEIARARVLYEQRVAPRVREGGDYFHEELVRTLADGDPQLLVKG